MIDRPIWRDLLKRAWRHAPIAWLSGVRRVGKTTLARSLDDILYLNCDLPSVAERLRDPESFFDGVGERIVVFDEVHQLPDPSRLLKIGADTRPKAKILATGSSTLSATQKFRDSLTGRKRAVHLVPVLAGELADFGVTDLRRRLLRGGLPEVLLADEHSTDFYGEWIDSYFARDVQELYRVDKRAGFTTLVETLLRQSGGLIEITSLAKASGLSRPTIMSYLEVLQVTHVVRLLRPFHCGGRREIVQQPKAYGFDTGFICHARGWGDLRTEDCGLLWEHLVLDTLLSIPSVARVHFWRDKQQREVDFVVPRQRDACDAIECKWTVSSFSPRGLAAFRESYRSGRNFVVASDVRARFERAIDGMRISFANANDLRALLG